MNKRLYAVFACLVALAIGTTLLVSTGAFSAAKQAKGKFEYVSGNVFTWEKGSTKKTKAKVGDPVYAGHFVGTGSGASCRISLLDGSDMNLKEKSRILINEAALKGGKDSAGFSVGLFLGSASMKAKKGRQSAKVYTPTMVAGVRGTEYTVAIADDGSSWVDVEEGEVNVGVEGSSMNVGQGKAAAVELGTDAVEEKPASDEQITSWLDDKEKEFAEDPGRTMRKIEKEMEQTAEAADKLSSEVRFAEIGREETMEELDKSYGEYEKRSDEFDRQRAVSEGLYACTESALEKPVIAAAAGKSKMVKRIRKVIKRHHDAMARLEKRISDAFGKIDQKYADASERISKAYDDKSKEIDDKFKSYEGSGLMEEED